MHKYADLIRDIATKGVATPAGDRGDAKCLAIALLLVKEIPVMPTKTIYECKTVFETQYLPQLKSQCSDLSKRYYINTALILEYARKLHQYISMFWMGYNEYMTSAMCDVTIRDLHSRQYVQKEGCVCDCERYASIVQSAVYIDSPYEAAVSGGLMDALRSNCGKLREAVNDDALSTAEKEADLKIVSALYTMGLNITQRAYTLDFECSACDRLGLFTALRTIVNEVTARQTLALLDTALSHRPSNDAAEGIITPMAQCILNRMRSYG